MGCRSPLDLQLSVAVRAVGWPQRSHGRARRTVRCFPPRVARRWTTPPVAPPRLRVTTPQPATRASGTARNDPHRVMTMPPGRSTCDRHIPRIGGRWRDDVDGLEVRFGGRCAQRPAGSGAAAEGGTAPGRRRRNPDLAARPQEAETDQLRSLTRGAFKGTGAHLASSNLSSEQEAKLRKVFAEDEAQTQPG